MSGEVTWNARHYLLQGYAIDEVTPSFEAWLARVHPHDRTETLALIEQARDEKRTYVHDFRGLHADGEILWCSARGRFFYDPNGQPYRMIGVMKDVTEQKRSEVALRTSEAKFRTLFESIDEGFLIHKMIRDQDGRVTDLRFLEANAALTRMTGLSKDDVGKLGCQFLPNLEQIWLDTFDRVARTGVPERFENYNEATGRWYNVHISQVSGTDDQVAVVYDDVTARKHAEIALREREERQAFLLKLSDALRPLADPADIQGETTRLLREQLDAGWCYYVDWDLDRKIGVVLRDSARDELPSLEGSHDVSDAPDFLRILEKGAVLTVRDYAGYEQLPTGIRRKFTALGFRSMIVAPLLREGRLIASLLVGDSEIRDWSPSEASLVAEVADRTWAAIERGRAEAALRESEERFQQFANASSGAIWIRNAETLAMEYVSPAIETIYGVSQEAFLGDMSRWAAMIVPEDREVALGHIQDARQGEPAVHEFRIQRPKDKAFRWIRNTDFPLYDARGNVERVGGIAQDITEEKLSVEHQAVLLAELQHRVRNIMAVLRSIAARTIHSAETVEDYAALMADRLNTFARVQALLTRAANVGVGLGTIVDEELRALAADAGQFEAEGPDVELSPKAAETMTLAVHELTTNALKYGGLSVPTGKVRIRWEIMDKSDTQWLSFDWNESGAPDRPISDKPRRIGLPFASLRS